MNNYTNAELQILLNLPDRDTRITYVCYGIESSPETGTPHLQGYMHLRATQSMSFVKRVLTRAHWEKRMGSPDHAINYCKKDGLFVQFGKAPVTQGHRSDLDNVHQMLIEGASMQAVSNAHFGSFIRYCKGLNAWSHLNSHGQVRLAPKIYWIWGPSGVGKTRRISQACSGIPTSEIYHLSNSITGTWWDGYHGQSVVVMDDLRASWMPHHQLLRIFDSTPLQVGYKGGMTPLLATSFYITTNAEPTHLYELDHANALTRRIHDFAWVWFYGHHDDMCPNATMEIMSAPKCHVPDETVLKTFRQDYNPIRPETGTPDPDPIVTH